MKKPIELRQHLTEGVPHLKKHPDKLLVFIEDGAVATKRSATLSYEYRYTLRLVVTDFADHADTLIVPLLAWLAVHQPDLIDTPEKRDKAIAFEAELIDHKSMDIAFNLELSERVLVQPAGENAYTCEHLGEPPLPDLGGPRGWEVYLHGELIGKGNP